MFKRLRTKVTLLFVAIGTFGIVGTTLVKTRSFLADKRNYVIEFNIVAAPHVASAIGHHLAYLRESFSAIDDLLRRGSRGEAGSSRLLESEFHRLDGVDGLSIYDPQGFVANLGVNLNANLGASPQDSPGDPIFARLRATTNGTIERRGSEPPVYAAWVGDRLYVARLRPDVFAEHFELARATSVSLVSKDGSVLLRGLNAAPETAVLERLISRLGARDKEAAVAGEVETASGDRVFAALAPVPGTDAAFVLVQAPVEQAVEMVRQILRGSLPIVGLMLLVSFAAGLVFTARLVRPIEELTEATSRIAVGHWKVDVRARPGDEIGRLVDAFSRMGGELEAREESLRQAHEELARSERLAALGLLGAGVAHEVKNPLNSIMGFAELIRQEDAVAGNETIQKYLGIILSESRRATGIVAELLTFARNKPPVLERERVAEVAKFALELHAAQAKKAGIELGCELRDEGVEARLDRDQLCQVLSNLMTNAIQALDELPPGAPRRLALRVVREGSWAVIEVADTGPGISREALPKIFDPFFSTKKASQGTGLGLAVSYSIVDSHGGKLEVTSTPGAGATFRVKLPVAG
jgi:signal transduction histidine kinase